MTPFSWVERQTGGKREGKENFNSLCFLCYLPTIYHQFITYLLVVVKAKWQPSPEAAREDRGGKGKASVTHLNKAHENGWPC
jgi:hypothetical protein